MALCLTLQDRVKFNNKYKSNMDDTIKHRRFQHTDKMANILRQIAGTGLALGF